MLRTANQRRNQILEAQLRVRLTRDELTAEGHFMRRVHDLKLVRSQNPLFSLSWTAMHPIDEHSPLWSHGGNPCCGGSHNYSHAEWDRRDRFQTPTLVTAMHEILWNMRFADILMLMPDGHRHIDYTRFHDVIPC